MRIAISGASGFVGRALTAYFRGVGYEVIPITRPFFSDGRSAELTQLLEGCQVVINLAGASINRRWTKSYLKEMFESRILVTQKLVSALHETSIKPSLFISVSAVGYYPTTGSHDDYSEARGEGILADLCNAWEKEATQAPKEIRVVLPRLGIVLAPHGGALKKLLLPLIYFRVAAVIAPGTQPFPWIGLDDLVRAFEHIIESEQLQGVVNLVAPSKVTQKQFVTEIARHYKAIVTVKLPVILFKLLYGKGASFLTTGQSVTPSKLVRSGFNYLMPTVSSFCHYACRGLKKR